ncbi:MAG: ABC transporter permease [Anaerolineaceae bacterium]|nr:ABC transporter permease [Anaerolineaceae bacterium]
MQRDHQIAQSTPNPLRGLIDSWLRILTKPSQPTYLAELANTGWLKTILGVTIFALAAGLFPFAAGGPSPVGAENGPAAGLLAGFLLAAGGFFLLNGFFFIVLKLYQGSGSFAAQCALLAQIVAPLSIVLLLGLGAGRAAGVEGEALLNPLSAGGILGALIVLFILYATALVLLALRTVHQVKSTQAVYTLGLGVGVWAVAAVAVQFVTQPDALIPRIGAFVVQQWQGGYLWESILGHFWMVLFSVLIAVVLGVVIGVLITMPVHRPQWSHLLFAIPLVIFFFIWAAASGLMGAETADQIASSVRTWDRSLRSMDGFFGGLFVILGAILRKPAAVGMLGMGLTAILYALILTGEKASQLTLYVAGIILTIPSIALFGVLIKPLGIGAFNAAFALILYAQLPILRNTYTGIKAVQPEIVEAGRGMGMTEFQLLREVKLPLAMPVIMTGLRVSTVMLVGVAAIAAYIGNNTLGDYIFAGIQRAQEVRYTTGAILVAVLALAVDYLLGLLQDRLTPAGFKERRKNG